MDWHIDQGSHWYFYGSDMCYSSRIDRDHRYKMIWRCYNWIMFPKGRKKSTHEWLACCRFPKIQRFKFYGKDAIWQRYLLRYFGSPSWGSKNRSFSCWTFPMPGPAMVSALRSVFLQMSSVAVLARIVPGAFVSFFFALIQIRANWKPYLTLDWWQVQRCL